MASYVSPSYRSAMRTGPDSLTSQLASVPITSTLPSVYSMRSSASNACRSALTRFLRVNTKDPTAQPPATVASNVWLAPVPTMSVTS